MTVTQYLNHITGGPSRTVHVNRFGEVILSIRGARQIVTYDWQNPGPGLRDVLTPDEFAMFGQWQLAHDLGLHENAEWFPGGYGQPLDRENAYFLIVFAATGFGVGFSYEPYGRADDDDFWGAHALIAMQFGAATEELDAPTEVADGVEIQMRQQMIDVPLNYLTADAIRVVAQRFVDTLHATTHLAPQEATP